MNESSDEGRRGTSAAYARFKKALLDFAEDPTKANIVRYLSASRAVDGEPQQDPPPGRRSSTPQKSSE